MSPSSSRLGLKILTLGVWLTVPTLGIAPVARAEMPIGNYEVRITGRYDFHTWVWVISSCSGGCVHVYAIARPVAKGFDYEGDAPLVNGRYTLTVDVPDGLRCGDVYYGPTVPTHDTYSWDATTLAGSLDSSFATGCDGAPAGTNTYPFTLSRM
jgi:hypothetical protein